MNQFFVIPIGRQGGSVNNNFNHQRSKVSLKLWKMLYQSIHRMSRWMGRFMIDQSNLYAGSDAVQSAQIQSAQIQSAKIQSAKIQSAQSHQPSSDDPGTNYDRQVSLYGFMPAVAEERDWLEKVYRLPDVMR
jgi:hypothetical protein